MPTEAEIDAMHPKPKVKNIYLRFTTEGNDKDAGEVVSTQVLRQDNNGVVATKGELGSRGHKWDNHTHQPDPQDSQWGPKGWFSLDMSDVVLRRGETALFYIRKAGGARWEFRIIYGVEYEGVAGIFERYHSGISYMVDDRTEVHDTFPA